jgi:hypothetical protein|tara:strand:- start:1673 stop:1957 length:285 start_codon:yes stop_codon:yes gene_type:complete
MSQLPRVKVSTGWINLTVIGEPTVNRTFRGYAPVLPVRINSTGLDYILYISASSIAEGLEPLREANNGLFSGLQFSIRKTGEEKFASYEIRTDL